MALSSKIYSRREWQHRRNVIDAPVAVAAVDWVISCNEHVDKSIRCIINRIWFYRKQSCNNCATTKKTVKVTEKNNILLCCKLQKFTYTKVLYAEKVSVFVILLDFRRMRYTNTRGHSIITNEISLTGKRSHFGFFFIMPMCRINNCSIYCLSVDRKLWTIFLFQSS